MNYTNQQINNIINMALKLGWIDIDKSKPYPVMQISEVEKCMLAMVNDWDYNRMVDLVNQLEKKNVTL